MFVVLIMLILPLGLGYWWTDNLKPVSSDNTKEVFVLKQGMSAAQIAQELQNMKLIKSSAVFRQLCRVNKADAKLMAGMYYLSPAMGAQEILDKLLKGPEPDAVKVTIPEGYNTAEIVAALVKNNLGTEDQFYQAIQSVTANEYAFLSDVPASGKTRLEGFLFPDTYFFDKKGTPRDAIDRFLQRFQQELTAETTAALQAQNMSVYTWVTKASIVEKEAQKADERPVIAGVFENRLKISMPLQSCATVQYVLGVAKPVLSLEDIEIKSPYNTYKNPGLPPGPIANPGHASLSAALNPAKTEYLYFVAKQDGSHAFAVTYNEHLKNVSKYQ